MPHISRSQAMDLVGKEIYALKRDGIVVKGRLVKVRGNGVVLQPTDGKARVQAILPLALFDILAISTLPFAGFGFGGFGGFGFPGGFWW